jgi:hypothetical protein
MNPYGQRLSERLFFFIMLATSAVSLFQSLRRDSLRGLLICFSAGSVLALAVCVPDWRFYRKNQTRWREPAELNAETSPMATDTGASEKVD